MFCDLADELVLKIFEYIDIKTVEELGRLKMVCRRFNYICKDWIILQNLIKNINKRTKFDECSYCYALYPKYELRTHENGKYCDYCYHLNNNRPWSPDLRDLIKCSNCGVYKEEDRVRLVLCSCGKDCNRYHCLDCYRITGGLSVSCDICRRRETNCIVTCNNCTFKICSRCIAVDIQHTGKLICHICGKKMKL